MADGLDIVQDCSEMLQNAESDVYKIAALLFAAQHIRSEECDSRSKSILFNSVGVDFLSRMLLGRLSIPDSEDCPKETYVSTALAIITGFCVDPDLARNKEMLQLVPHILKILEDCDEPLLEESLQYLRCIIQHPEGRRSMLSHGAMKRFASLYSRLKSDEIVDMTLILTQTPGVDDVWEGNSESFESLISGVATEFEKTNSKRKFKLCSALRCLMYSYNKDQSQNEVLRVYAWHKKVFSGLQDILTSRIEGEQRDPALKLAAMMLDRFGLVWTDDDSERGQKFQLLLVHLSSIEVRMQLEDQPLEKILKNADLVTSCFTILEVAITQLLQYSLDSRVKSQIVESFTAAGAAVLSTLKSIVNSSTRSTSEEKFFIYAMIRFLSLGLAHEVMTLNSTVYEVMPFVMEVTVESFYSYKNWYEENSKIETNALARVGGVQPADFLPVLLPALRNFAIEDPGRKLILGLMDVFLDSLAFRWGIVKNQLTLMREKSGNCVNCEGVMVHKEQNDIWQESKSTIVCLLELLMETIIIQPKVAENPKFSTVFAFIIKMLPDLDPNNAYYMPRPLHATVSILGLLLIKHQTERPSENDPNVLLVVKSSLCFLKPYFNTVRTTDDSVFASKTNPKFWVSIKELWFLGMYTLKKLMELLPWIKPDIENEVDSTIMAYLISDGDLRASYSGPP